MNPEQPKFNKEANLIQRDLIAKSGEDPKKWVEENAADFRELIEKKPKLVRLHEKSPEVLEDFISKKLQDRNK